MTNGYVVITQINAAGQLIPIGTLIDGNEFTAEQIQEQIRLQVIRPATADEFPVEVPGVEAETSTGESQ